MGSSIQKSLAENHALRKILQVQATEVAQRVVGAFLQKQSRDKADWDLLSSTVHPSGGQEPWTPMQRIFLRENVIENEYASNAQTQTEEAPDGNAELYPDYEAI